VTCCVVPEGERDDGRRPSRLYVRGRHSPVVGLACARRAADHSQRLPSLLVPPSPAAVTRIGARGLQRHLPILRRVLTRIDHVGIGSDFDGVQATLSDLASVADLPNLTRELLRRGYSESDIDKILGGNMLRVMEEVERLSH